MAARSAHERSTRGSDPGLRSARACAALLAASRARPSRLGRSWRGSAPRGVALARTPPPRRTAITSCAARSIGVYGVVAPSGRRGSPVGFGGTAAAICSFRSSFPSSHRTRARAFACAMLSAGIERSVSSCRSALRGLVVAGVNSAMTAPISSRSPSSPRATFSSAVAPSGVSANAMRSPSLIGSLPTVTPCRVAEGAFAPGAPLGSAIVTRRVSRRTRAAALMPLVVAAHASRGSMPTMQISLFSPRVTRSFVMMLRARSVALAPALVSKELSASSTSACPARLVRFGVEIMIARAPSVRSSVGVVGMRRRSAQLFPTTTLVVAETMVGRGVCAVIGGGYAYSFSLDVWSTFDSRTETPSVRLPSL